MQFVDQKRASVRMNRQTRRTVECLISSNRRELRQAASQ